jgi:inner membrane protein
MDTITHGIAGALISKAAFGGRDLFPPSAIEKKRLTTWALMIGAIFPDSDVLREFFSNNPMLMITWHRSLTHSLLLTPIWSVLLAGLTGAIARWRKWKTPSFLALTGLYAVGILSHIFLDLLTTYGTMIWSPLEWSRPAWDILFIVDFTFTAILLIPQLLAWTYEDPERAGKRALILWAIFTPTPLLIARIGMAVGAPISSSAVLVAMVLFALLFFLPAALGWGLRVRYQTSLSRSPTFLLRQWRTTPRSNA